MKIPKYFRLMNMRLDVVVKDIVGLTGSAIIQSFIDGEKFGEQLAKHRHYNCRKPEKEIAKALEYPHYSIRFRFIERSILGKKFTGTEENLLDLEQLQEKQNGSSFYQSEEDLLNDILKHKDVKHYRQLRYLASKHEGSTLKLRFVLNPFSVIIYNSFFRQLFKEIFLN